MAALCGAHILCPAERGFRPLHVGPVSLPITFVVTTVVFLQLLATSRRQVLAVFLRPYARWQSLFVVLLASTALYSESASRALAIALFYFGTFVLNYVIVVRYFESGRRPAFILTLCCVGVAAATVGILEALAGIRLPFYAAMEQQYRMIHYIGDFAEWNRSSGTLGNPITFGVAMCGIVPFAMESRWRFLRWCAPVLMLTAAALTVSRTVLGLMLALLVGYLVSFRHRPKGALGRNALLALILLACLMRNDAVNDSIVQPWADRIGLGADQSSQANVDIRLDWFHVVTESAANDSLMANIFGHGLGSSTDLADSASMAASEVSGTLDNTFLTLYIELGLLGLFAFLLMWGLILYALRGAFWTPYHYHSMIGWMALGLSFVHIYYATSNLPFVASMAALTAARRPRTLLRGAAPHLPATPDAYQRSSA